MARSVVLRIALGAAVWWSMVEGDGEVLAYGLVAVPVAVLVSLWLSGPSGARGGCGRVRPIPALFLLGWLGARTLTGSVDVARRALSAPSVDVDPHWETYETMLASRSARVTLALITSLLPGTLSARVDGQLVTVHVISPGLDAAATMADLEERLSRAGAR